MGSYDGSAPLKQQLQIEKNTIVWTNGQSQVGHVSPNLISQDNTFDEGFMNIILPFFFCKRDICFTKHLSSTAKQILMCNFPPLFIQVPVSQCTAPCPPGSRQARRPGEPHCCFDCLPCAEGEISNQSGRTFLFCSSLDFLTSVRIEILCY